MNKNHKLCPIGFHDCHECEYLVDAYECGYAGEEDKEDK